MKRRLALVALTISVLAGGALVVRFAPPPGADAAASVIYADQACQPDGSDTVAFSWQGNDASAQQQWLDVSPYDNGWQQGTYVSAGPLKPSVNALQWAGYTTGVTYYVRVNQQLAGGSWDPSQTFQFRTSCTSSSATQATPSPTGTSVSGAATSTSTPTTTPTPGVCPQFSGRPPFSGTPPAAFGGGPSGFNGAPPNGFGSSGGRPPFSGTPPAGFPAGCAPSGLPSR